MKKIWLILVIVLSLFTMFGCEDVVLPDDMEACHDLEFSNVIGGLEVTGIGTCTHSELVIPSVHNGKKVISIGRRAFMDCDTITAIAIPGSVKKVKSEAFIGCDLLTTVYIQHGVKKLQTALFYSADYATLNTQYSIYYDGTTAEFVELEGWDIYGGSARPWYYSGFNTIIFTVYCTDGYMDYNYHNVGEKLEIKKYEDKIQCPTHVDNNEDFICDNCDEKLPGYGETSPEKEPSVGLAFTLNEDGKSYSLSGIGTCTDAEIVIPSQYEGLPVTGIAMQAFVDPDYEGYEIIDPTNVVRLPLMPGNPTVRSIVIPDTVKNIAEGAFYGCIKLTDVTIPASVETIGVAPFVGCLSLVNIKVDSKNVDYQSVDGNIYSKDGKTLVQYAPGKTGQHFVVPNSVTSIGDGAFCLCTSLTNVTIPNSVTTIGEGVFCFCTGLTSVTIPDSVTTIDDCALRYCFSLTSVTIPDGVTTIGASAFEFCVSLTNLEIPNSVATFGKYAFASCNLTSVTYKGTVSMWKVLYEGHFGRECTVYCTDGHISKDGTVIYN